MTTKQLRVELMETRAKIRAGNEALKVLRTRHTELKARLSEARAAKNINGNTP
jgi:hypothetical protein